MNGYVTKDGLWAAVPYASKFMVLNNGKQGQVFSSLEDAVAFISKQTKARTRVSSPKKPKKSKNSSQGSLAPHLQ